MGKGMGGLPGVSRELRTICRQHTLGKDTKDENDGEDGCRVRQKPFFYSILLLFFCKEGVTVGSRQASLVIEYLQSCLRKQTQAEKGFSIGMREG